MLSAEINLLKGFKKYKFLYYKIVNTMKFIHHSSTQVIVPAENQGYFPCMYILFYKKIL